MELIRYNLSNIGLGTVSKVKVSPYSSIKIISSPTSNCQLSSLANAQLLEGMSKKDLEIFMGFYPISGGRRIMVLDIKEMYLEELKKILKPYYNKFNIKRYVSANSSNMVLCTLKLNMRKVREVSQSHRNYYEKTVKNKRITIN